MTVITAPTFALLPSSAFYGARTARVSGVALAVPPPPRRYLEGLLRTGDVLLSFETVPATLEALLSALEATIPVHELILVETERGELGKSRTRSVGTILGKPLDRLEDHTRAAYAYLVSLAETLDSEANPGVEVAIPLVSREGAVVAVLLAVSTAFLSELDLTFLTAVGAQLSKALARHNDAASEPLPLISSVRAGGEESDHAGREALLRTSRVDQESPRKGASPLENGRDRVLAMVAHDLRQPLNAILLAVTGLIARTPPGVEQRVFGRQELGIIKRSVDRMSRLAEDLLDVATLDVRGLRLDCAEVSARDLIDELVALLGPVAASRGVSLRRQTQRAIPPIWGDAGRILQVLLNLTGNALKFTPRGGAITIITGIDGERVSVSVRDTGIGIRPADRTSVFIPFWQADTTSSAGTGIGLTIANEIVMAHGGAIAIEATPGGGTTFTFTLPIAPPSE